MIYKKFGNTGESIPAIGFGTCINDLNRSTTYKDLEYALHGCIEKGVTFFDTAPVYGNGESEEMLGRLFSDKRDEIFLATKFSPMNAGYAKVIESTEQSLHRLKTNNIDLLQIHWPNTKIPIGETLMAMEKLVKDGKVRHIGVSNFSLKELKEALSLTNLDISSIQVEYNLFDRSIESDLLPFCKKNNIAVIGYSPLVQGRYVNGLDQIGILDKLSKKYNATKAQIVLCWLIDDPNVFAIPNTTKKKRILENINSLGIEISNEDKKIISDKLKTTPKLIETKKIRVTSEYNRKVYTNTIQALENRMNLSPSPLELSTQIKSGDFLKTIRLKKIPITNDGKEYDLVEGRLRYWAWVIAHGWDIKIPALIWA